MLFDVPITQLLGLTVLGTLVATLGSLFGIVLKDFFFSRSFEVWKQRKTLEQTYQKYRDPLWLSGHELTNRIREILETYPTEYLNREVLGLQLDGPAKNSADDPYFKRYKLISTLYRFCSFFGWLELYRQEVTFLNSGNNRHSTRLGKIISAIRGDLADGHLNTAKDWLDWEDALIFREELRAIGEAMIETRGTTRAIIGYGRFCERFDIDSPSEIRRWAQVAMHFFFVPKPSQRDFRRIRLLRLFGHLIGLLECIGDIPIENRLAEFRVSTRKELQEKGFNSDEYTSSF